MLAKLDSHSSVVATTVVVYPPAAIALLAPPEAGIQDPLYLAADKSLSSVQEVPFQNSVFAVLPGGGYAGPARPPYTNA